jgi:hypothetical protein
MAIGNLDGLLIAWLAKGQHYSDNSTAVIASPNEVLEKEAFARAIVPVTPARSIIDQFAIPTGESIFPDAHGHRLAIL